MLSVIQAETVFLSWNFPESLEPLWWTTQARSEKKYKNIPYVSKSLKVLVHISVTFKLHSCSKACKNCLYFLAIENLSGGLWHNSQYVRHFQLKTHHKEKGSRTPRCQVGPWDILSQELCTAEVADLLCRKQVPREQSTWLGIWECILEQTERAVCLNSFSETSAALIPAYALNTWYFICQYHA